MMMMMMMIIIIIIIIISQGVIQRLFAGMLKDSRFLPLIILIRRRVGCALQLLATCAVGKLVAHASGAGSPSNSQGWSNVSHLEDPNRWSDSCKPL